MEDYLAYDGTALPYMLVNAVKEQQELLEDKDVQIEELTNRLADVEDQLNDLLTKLDEIVTTNAAEAVKTQVQLNGTDLANLSQNRPNPFTGSTVIEYSIPQQTGEAHLNIYDQFGKVIKTVEIDHKGEGQLEVQAIGIPAGTYSYSLVIDGVQSGTKQMILAH